MTLCRNCNFYDFVPNQGLELCVGEKGNARIIKGNNEACNEFIEKNSISNIPRHDTWNKLPKKNKYNAVKTQVDGIWFDSKMEAEYYGLLRIKKLAGEIDFKTHPKYQLTKTISWKLDFEVENLKTGIITYVDIKGVRLASFNRNLRLWNEVRDDPITLVTKKGKQWIEQEV